MFKPNVSPLLLDQMPRDKAKIKVLPSGERVIVDPEATSERTMLWFYLLINIGGFMQTATSYAEKYVGWWLAFILPLFLYIPLPLLLVCFQFPLTLKTLLKAYVFYRSGCASASSSFPLEEATFPTSCAC
jgi:dipeptide/tripeptide permease